MCYFLKYFYHLYLKYVLPTGRQHKVYEHSNLSTYQLNFYEYSEELITIYLNKKEDL